MSVSDKNQARFDARLPKSQKDFFEKAALLGGYRSLTDFVILTVQEKAAEIILEKERVLASERDCQLFFDAITQPKAPNEALKKAWADYQAFRSEAP